MFEITIIERDSLGNPIVGPNGVARTKTFSSVHASDVSDFWARHHVRPAKKKVQQATDVSSDSKRIEKIKRNKKSFDDGTKKND